HSRDFEHHAHQGEEELPIKGGMLESPFDRSVKTEVNEGIKFPDLFFVGTDPARRARHHGVEHGHGRGQMLVPDQYGGQAYHHAYHSPYAGTAQKTPARSPSNA